MKQLTLVIALVTMLFSACDTKKSAEYQTLLQENDSLRLEAAKGNSEMEDMLSLLNEIDDNFQKIKAAENYLTVQSTKSGELTPTTKDRINSDMKLLAETLTKNKEQIAKLKAQLKNSNVQSSQLNKLIEKLQNEMEEKTAMITELQVQLSQRDERIAELDEVVSALSIRSTLQDALIERQDASINTAYYCFGTTKELKDEKILTGGGFSPTKVLQPGFNKNYFTPIDIRNVTSIPLQAKKAKMKSNHPEGSYELTKDADSNGLTLKITNVSEFWSLGRYLVIEVDL